MAMLLGYVLHVSPSVRSHGIPLAPIRLKTLTAALLATVLRGASVTVASLGSSILKETDPHGFLRAVGTRVLISVGIQTDCLIRSLVCLPAVLTRVAALVVLDVITVEHRADVPRIDGAEVRQVGCSGLPEVGLQGRGVAYGPSAVGLAADLADVRRPPERGVCVDSLDSDIYLMSE